MAKGKSKDLHIVSQLRKDLSSSIFEDLVEHFPDIIHSVNADGEIISTNRKAQEMLGYTKEELIGMHIVDLYAPSVRNFLEQGFQELKNRGFSKPIESKLKSKDGEIIDVEIRSFSLYNSSNQFDRSFSIIRDLREKKRLQSQLFQQSKLAGIGELSAGIIHDIRNPLSIIMGLNRTVLKRLASQIKSKAFDDARVKIDKASESINRLCSHLRDYMRQEHEENTTVQVKRMIEDSLLICENRIKSSKVTVICEVENAALEYTLPSNSIEQVIINIVSNACDALAESPVREVRIRAAESSSSYTIEIEDTGPGVAQKIKDQIFESFFTTKSRGQGTGLGLSICKGIVEEAGGSLALDETYQTGARFVITMPAPKTNSKAV